MKKSLLLSAALLAAASAYAQEFDVYVIGGDVNGQSWATGAEDAKMTYNETTGLYEWDGETLGNGFKFNDGTWENPDHNWGGSDKMVLGQEYALVAGGDSGNISFLGLTGVNKPHIVFNAAEGTCTVTGEGIEPSGEIDFDVYVIGSNVNGKTWATGEEDAKMTHIGGGIFEWDGEFLGTGFKFNDGSWNNADHNWGGASKLTLGENYRLDVGGSSANIAYDGFTGVNKPHVVFDANEGSIVVTGEATGVIEWFFTGTFNDWDISDETGLKLEEVGEKQYKLLNIDFDTLGNEGEFKIASTGWSEQYGSNDGLVIGMGEDEGELQAVGSDGGVVYYLYGTYDLSWDGNAHFVKFQESSAVKAVEAVNGAATYFNLQGVQVSEPANGMFIKVVAGKATKVAIR